MSMITIVSVQLVYVHRIACEGEVTAHQILWGYVEVRDCSLLAFLFAMRDCEVP